MTNRRTDLNNIVITSIILLLICLFLSETAPHKNLGFYELSKKKESIIQLWITENRVKAKHHSDSFMVSGVN